MARFDPFPVLHTPRLTLRELAPTDAAEMFRCESDPAMTNWYDRPPVPSLEAMQEKLAGIIAETNAGTSITWVIADRGSGGFLGTVCYWHWDLRSRRAEIGYGIAPEAWGRGLASEALRPVLAYGFAEMELHGVHAFVHPDNLASVRVVEKLGFRKEGHLREAQLRARTGAFEDLAVWGLLAREFSGFPGEAAGE